jgi:hypothetical protein
MSEEQVAEVSEAVDAPEVTQSVADWRDSIPEEIRGHSSLEHINDIGALAKSYVHAQQMVGADKIALPGKSATADEWGEVYAKLGRPESPDNYEFSYNNLPEGAEMDDGMVSWFKETAHKAGMNPQQAQVMLDAYNEMTFGQAETMGAELQAQVDQVESDLRKEFGNAFDDRMNLANGVLAEFGNSEMTEIQLADGTLLGDNPEVIRMLANMGVYLRERVGEDTLEGVQTNGGVTPSDAMQKISELTQPNTPYWDSRHPEHQWYVQEAMKWREYATG